MGNIYFVFHAQKLLDGTITNEIFNFSSIETARQNYHYWLSVNIGIPALAMCMALIIDGDGKTVEYETWYNENLTPPQPEPESEPEVEEEPIIPEGKIPEN